MNDYENLLSKSTEDLRQIAVAFGDFTEEESEGKSREELIAALAKQAPKKRGRKSKAQKEAEAAMASVEAAKEEAAKETSETSTETVVEDKPAPKKRGRKSKAEKEAEEAAKEPQEQITIESIIEAAPAEDKTDAEVPSKPEKGEGRNIKSKRRRLSFGPDKALTEVEVTPEQLAAEEAQQKTVEQPVPVEETYTEIEGILSVGSEKNDFCGFVHTTNFLPGEDDAYVPGQMIKKFGLRKGDKVKGMVAPPRAKEKFPPLRKILEINGIPVPEDGDTTIFKKRPKFESLTAIYPNERLTLETEKEDISTRIIDLFCPIGKGQRGMVVSPPKAGKTILLQKIANSITANNPSCKLIVLLIDERPEEVTDMQRSIKGEVVYSTFDKRPENHVRVTELVLEHAMRQVELGEDVVILLDSMTRLARAYNLTINPTGRTLSGGLDPGSLYGPKRFFGAARNIENGGSLTIIATALIETGSRMDEVIFEEFKGTGNMEVVLDRKLADRRCFPAIAVDKSGTRREDLLIDKDDLDVVWTVRKRIAEVDTIAATQAVIEFMKKTSNNRYFIESARKSFVPD